MLTESGRVWTTSEYIARFKYSHTLKGLLTESETDRHFFRWFLRRSHPDVEVLPERVVRYERESIERLGLRSGVKGKLLAVAIGLTDSGIGQQACVVVDRDDDGRSIAPPDHVLVTDMWSLEMYAFEPTVLDDLMGQHFARAHVVTGDYLYARVDPVVRWAACARTALRRQSPSVALLSNWLSFVDAESDPPTIRSSDIIRESLRSAGRSSTSADIDRVEDEIAEHVNSDVPTSAIARGHDFSDVLLAVLKGKKVKNRGVAAKTWDREALEGALRAVLDREYLDNFALFVSLETRWST